MLPYRPLLIILRVMAAGSSYTTHCSKIPQQVPQNQSSPVMNKFCFQLGLTRHSTARPIPAPEHSPAKKLPKVIAPPIYAGTAVGYKTDQRGHHRLENAQTAQECRGGIRPDKAKDQPNDKAEHQDEHKNFQRVTQCRQENATVFLVFFVAVHLSLIHI